MVCPFERQTKQLRQHGHKPKACGLWQAEHNVHDLHPLAGSALNQIILHHKDYEKI
jgi:hypothetical protein